MNQDQYPKNNFRAAILHTPYGIHDPTKLAVLRKLRSSAQGMLRLLSATVSLAKCGQSLSQVARRHRQNNWDFTLSPLFLFDSFF